MEIRIGGTVSESIVDGPGIRFVVFCQGCLHDCPGCHNPESHDLNGGTLVDVEDLWKQISKGKLMQGVTFSGGEPFLQAEPLVDLAQKVKAAGLDLVVYTGYLFEELRELRYKIAQENAIAHFIIFHDSSLKEMATYFPNSKEEFLKIKGVGLKKYESYGEQFMEVIRNYTIKNNIDTSKVQPVMVEVPGKQEEIDRYEMTYNYYLEGLDLDEIAAKRNFTVNTIIKHLEKCQKNGQVVDWSRFIDSTKEEKILYAIDKIGLERLRPIKEALPEEISYEDIKITIVKNGLK